MAPWAGAAGPVPSSYLILRGWRGPARAPTVHSAFYVSLDGEALGVCRSWKWPHPEDHQLGLYAAHSFMYN